MQFALNNYMLTFFDKYRYMAMYSKSDRDITDNIVLYDEKTDPQNPVKKYYKLSVSAGKLNINAVTKPSVTEGILYDFSFTTTPNANDVWFRGDTNEIVIGMGDIRNGAVNVDHYDLDTTSVTIVISSDGENTLRIFAY